MQNAFNDSLNKTIGEGLSATAQSHLLAGLTSFGVSIQEIWEYKEIKKCVCPPHISSQGLSSINILWLLFLSLPMGTPFLSPCPWSGNTSVQWKRKCQIHPADGCAFPTISAQHSWCHSPCSRGMWVMLQQKAETAKLLQHQEENSCSTEWTGSAHTSKLCLSHPSQVSPRRRQPSQAQNTPPEIVESVVFHVSFTK